MMLTMSSSEVSDIKMTNLWVPKINGDSWPCVTNVAFSVHAVFQDFECVHGIENDKASACESWKLHFLPGGEYLCVHTRNLDLIMQKDS